MEIPPAKVRQEKFDLYFATSLLLFGDVCIDTQSFFLFLSFCSIGLFGAEVFDSQGQHRRKAGHYGDADA
jgi:hypothetical protein